MLLSAVLCRVSSPSSRSCNVSHSQISELPPTFTSHHPYLCKLGDILQSGPSNLSTPTSALSFWFYSSQSIETQRAHGCIIYTVFLYQPLNHRIKRKQIDKIFQEILSRTFVRIYTPAELRLHFQHERCVSVRYKKCFNSSI